MTMDVYVNSQPNTMVTGIIMDGKKIAQILYAAYYPLTEELIIDAYNVPTRQQLHSRKNYIINRYTHLNKVYVKDLKTAKSELHNKAREIIKERHPYASNLR